MKSKSRKTICKIILFVTIITLMFNLPKSITIVKAQLYNDISVQDAYNMINNNTLYPNLIVLDVRDQSEYDANHICDATLIPLSELESRLNELQPYNETEIIVYCLSGYRSVLGSQILVNNSFTKIYNMLDGITGWISAGYETCPVKNGQSTISFTFNIFVIGFLGASLIIILYLRKKIKKKS
ncbi:Thiosulfate sulfurtransferase GlpE [subsurface metagenome]